MFVIRTGRRDLSDVPTATMSIVENGCMMIIRDKHYIATNPQHAFRLLMENLFQLEPGELIHVAKAQNRETAEAAKLLINSINVTVPGNFIDQPADHTHEHFESIDAAIFSGDTFDLANNRDLAVYYMARWLRQFARIAAEK